ncbi:glutaminyl-peptide cyclotransferase [Facklamia hominis]
MQKVFSGIVLIIMSCLLFTHAVDSQGIEGKAELLEVFPLEKQIFTQGFERNEQGTLYLGSGKYGQSAVGILDLTSGEWLTQVELPDQYFGEGLTIEGNHLWQLTWKEGKVFKWQLPDFTLLDTYSYLGQGWGLAYDVDRSLFWLSDGSSQLYQQNLEDFKRLGQVTVTLLGREIDQLNELEYAQGAIFANIWYDNRIIKIDPETGQVIKVYDLSSILDQLPLSDEARRQMDSLNGIAHIDQDRFYITGKYYPFVLEVRLKDE